MTKPTKWVCSQRRLRSAWASAQSDQSSLSAWRKLGSWATHLAHSEDSDQTGRMPRLIWVFAGRTLILLVLSCRGSFVGKCPFFAPHCSHSMWKFLWFLCLLSMRMTKPTKCSVRPAKTEISLRICMLISEPSLCAQWVAKDPMLLQPDSEDWSNWEDAQADLSLYWAHMSFCWFCRAAARFP